jgi:hypothetical protein
MAPRPRVPVSKPGHICEPLMHYLPSWHSFIRKDLRQQFAIF